MPLRCLHNFALCLILAVSSAFIFCVTAWSAAIHPGFQTLGLWDSETGLRLDVALWYPSARVPTEVRYDDWSFSASRNARPAEGRHPLIVLSHDSEGSRFSLNILAAKLASCGFVVAAPTHKGDNVDDMSLIFSLAQLSGRTHEVQALITELLRSPQVEGLIDAQRIGILGVGPGATAALLLGGARLDASGWPRYCAKAGANDPYCTPWSAARMDSMVKTPNLQRDMSDRRIRAIAAVAPAYGMLFSPQSLNRLKNPLLLLRADLDAVNRAPHHADAIRAALPQPFAFDVLKNTDSASLIAPCSSTLAQTLPEMCTGVTEERREKTQEQLADLSVNFFLKNLGALYLPPVLPEKTAENVPEDTVDQKAKPGQEPDAIKQGALKPTPPASQNAKPTGRKTRSRQ